MKTIRRIVAVAGAAMFAGAAHASLLTSDPAIADYTGGTPFGIYHGASTGDVIGFRFTADANLVVSALGVLDDPSDGVLDSSHMVGLWRNSDQALLASVAVDSTGSLIGGWYYEDITPVALTSGESYTLGAMYTATDNDSYISSPTALVLNGISNTNGVFPAAGDLGFVYPSEDSTNLARLGPNMLIRVPAPSVLALLGVAGLASRRRRRE